MQIHHFLGRFRGKNCFLLAILMKIRRCTKCTKCANRAGGTAAQIAFIVLKKVYTFYEKSCKEFTLYIYSTSK